tara:strand:+ start:108 stop:653 length:546 start_codon:yes stop_codon:yes gene_type:complete
MSKLFVDEIVHQSSQGSGTITIGASGEKIDLGATAGGTLSNRPAWYAFQGSDQTLTSNTWTKLNLDTVLYDTNSGYDTTNKRFVVPTGFAGKYSFSANYIANSMANGKRADLRFYINGSFENRTYARETTGKSDPILVQSHYTINLNENDYVEVYVNQANGTDVTATSTFSFFSGNRLIGV